MTQAELLRYLVDVLEELGIEYMIGGSHASIYYYKMLSFQAGGSERHLRDIAGMLVISGAEIDTGYISDWAARLGLADIWGAVLRRARET